MKTRNPYPPRSSAVKTDRARWKVSPGIDAATRFELIAARYELTGPMLAAIAVSELSYVRPELFFQALASIPDNLKDNSSVPRVIPRQKNSTAA
jgi:hypothetical protein